MIDFKDRRSQLALGVVVMAVGLVGYLMVVARPVYGPSSVGIDIAAQSEPDPDLGEARAARGPGSGGATQNVRLQGDSDQVAGDDAEAVDSQKKIRKGQRGGRKRSRKSANQEKDVEKKKEQPSPGIRQRGAPFRKAPSGL